MKSLIQSMYDFDLVDVAADFVKELNSIDKSRASRSGHIQKTTFAPSKVGAYEGACPRYWYYALQGTDGVDEPGWQGMRYMENGTDRHDRFEELLARFDEEAVIEEEYWSDDPPSHGFIDGQIKWNNVDWVVEFKTTGLSAFKKMRSSGRPRGYHLIQLLVYMYIKKKEYGMLVYECRDNMKMFAIPVKMEGELDKYAKYVVDWLNEVHATSNDGELPPRAFTKSSWACKGCPFKETCWDEDAEPDNELGKLEELKF